MKYTIIAPHYDDEFIGCYKFIHTYKQDIKNIIFVTKSDYSTKDFVPIELAIMRKAESEVWIRSINPEIKIHHLNLPDRVDVKHLRDDESDFIKKHGTNRIAYTLDKIEEIAEDNVVVCPYGELHASHLLTYGMCCALKSKKIFYFVYELFKNEPKNEKGFYKWDDLGIEKVVALKWNSYVYGIEEFAQKKLDFEFYYKTQFEDLKESNMIMNNHEMYYSEVDIELEVK